MIPEFELKKIIDVIKDGLANGITAQEILLGIEEVRPSRVIEIEKEPKTTKEQREYMKSWREEKKRAEKIKDRMLREDETLEKCLKRTGFMCNQCGRVKISDPKTNTHQYIQKKNRKRVSIVIINKCPKCQGTIKLFGGFKLNN